MERFKKYIGREIKLQRVKDSEKLAACGITCRYLPDPPEDFDEFEFACEHGGKTVLILAAVEMGKLKRLLFTVPDAADPEITRPLTETQLQEFLAAKGEKVSEFLDHITAG